MADKIALIESKINELKGEIKLEIGRELKENLSKEINYLYGNKWFMRGFGGITCGSFM